MLGMQCAEALVTGTGRMSLQLQGLSSMSYDGYAYVNATSFALVLAWPTPSNVMNIVLAILAKNLRLADASARREVSLKSGADTNRVSEVG